jgi:uncharacterized DUF497 family protein
MDFEWDRSKAKYNRRKHRITFEEAHTVFSDPLARIFNDPDHSLEEKRELIIGHSTRGRLLVVSFTDRGETVRIVSARAATKRERKEYEEEVEHP